MQKQVKNKLYKFITYNDVIGFFYDDIKPYKVVRSNGLLLGGHDPFFWFISNEGEFVTMPKASDYAKRKSKKYQGWLDTLSAEDCKLLFDTFFGVFGKNDTIYDLGKNLGKNILENKELWKTIEPDKKKRLQSSIKNLIKFLITPTILLNKK